MSTTVGWAALMYRGIAAAGIDLEPIPHRNMPVSLFFIGFIIVGSFFMLNLFVGVVISTYNREKEKLGKDFLLTTEQKKWLETKLLLIQSKPKALHKEPKNKIRNFFYRLVHQNWFEYVIIVCIVLNTCTLAIHWY